MLTAKGSILIEKPISEVWETFTKPNSPQSWIDDEGGVLLSDWKFGDLISWKNKEGEDYYRGTIIKIITEQYISFNFHDAFEEDHHDPDFGEDWNIETWELIFENKNDSTMLTLAVGDYDLEHNSDDEHDHEATEKICIDMTERIIPKMLSKIRDSLISK